MIHSLAAPLVRATSASRCIALAVLIITAGGCAKQSDKIEAAHVSTVPYMKLTCDELRKEYLRANQQAMQVTRRQDEIANNDSAAMAIGMILFWPALFAIESDDKRVDVARLKGEINAVEQIAIEKDCTDLHDRIAKDRMEMEKLRIEREKAKAAADSARDGY